MKMRTALWTALALGLLGVGVVAEEPATADDCAACHEDYVDSFEAGSHGRAMMSQSVATFQESCVVCHGPGTSHMDEMSAETIRRLPDRQACVQCHSDSSVGIERSTPAHNRQVWTAWNATTRPMGLRSSRTYLWTNRANSVQAATVR